MTLGLFQKVVLADDFSRRSADTVFDGAVPGALDAWLWDARLQRADLLRLRRLLDDRDRRGAAASASPCRTISVFPYAAVGFSDFWRRWHISLSSWLRDYLYIPLGGNRHGERRTYRNLMLTMLLGGLWHGAELDLRRLGRPARHVSRRRAMAAQRVAATSPGPFASLGWVCSPIALVNVTWVFFRAKTSTRPGRAQGMFGLEWRQRTDSRRSAFDRGERDHRCDRSHALAHAHADPGITGLSDTRCGDRGGCGQSCCSSIIVEQGTGNAFIYFQF